MKVTWEKRVEKVQSCTPGVGLVEQQSDVAVIEHGGRVFEMRWTWGGKSYRRAVWQKQPDLQPLGMFDTPEEVVQAIVKYCQL